MNTFPGSSRIVAVGVGVVLAGALASLLPAPAAAQALNYKTLPAANLDQAVGLLMGQMAVNDVRRSMCGEAFPQLRRDADLEAFRWQQRHVAEIAAARSKLGKDGLQKLKPVDAAQRAKAAELFGAQIRSRGAAACTGFIDGLRSGTDELERKSPDAERLLNAYTREHPQDAVERQRVENVGTCTQRGLESGATYRVILPYCDCVIEKALPLVAAADRPVTASGLPMDRASLIQETSARLSSDPQFMAASQQCARDSGLLAELQAAGVESGGKK